ncbi:MAG: hypothetical protein IPP80_10480 [Ignavibacteria bacterium]|nr:hypothetical protein [Ignavibacteria bacterium]
MRHKDTADLVIGTIRLFHVPDIYPDDMKLMHWAYRTLRRTMGTMQMDLLTPPNVTNDLMKDGIQLDESYEKSYADVFVIKDWLSDPQDPSKLVDELSDILFPVAILPEQRQALIDIVLEGQPSTAWSTAWAQWEGAPDDEALRAVVESRLRNLLKFMLAMAENQVC